MKMNGEQVIAAPRARVWEALNDPEVLRQCIPGCQTLEKVSDERMNATVQIKIGPIGARFTGAVTLSELDPPNSYLISGEGQGGTAGFAKGGARVELSDHGDATRLTYTVDAEVGGRLAQVGGPIVDATAKQLAGQFFKRFGALVAKQEAPAAAPAGSAASASPAITAPSPAPAFVSAPVVSQPTVLPWILVVLLAAFAGYLAGKPAGTELLPAVLLAVALAGVALAGYVCGRRAGPVVVTLDSSVAQLLARQSGGSS